MGDPRLCRDARTTPFPEPLLILPLFERPRKKMFGYGLFGNLGFICRSLHQFCITEYTRTTKARPICSEKIACLLRMTCGTSWRVVASDVESVPVCSVSCSRAELPVGDDRHTPYRFPPSYPGSTSPTRFSSVQKTRNITESFSARFPDS